MSSEERRASIVEAACNLFADKGFRGTTTRELAAAVGVTEPVLYEHFGTKRDLYAAIIESKAKHSGETILELSERYMATDDDRGFFMDLGNLIVDKYMGDPTFVRLLLFSNLENHDLKELFHSLGNNCFEMVSKHLERRMTGGAMRKADPKVAARAFFGMVAHYAMSGLVFGFAPFDRPSKEIVREMVDIYLSGMCVQET